MPLCIVQTSQSHASPVDQVHRVHEAVVAQSGRLEQVRLQRSRLRQVEQDHSSLLVGDGPAQHLVGVLAHYVEHSPGVGWRHWER